jgi:hypothetical protein
MQLDITAERFIERVVLRLDESSGKLLDAAVALAQMNSNLQTSFGFPSLAFEARRIEW